MTRYVRPIPQTDPARPEPSFLLADGWCWFDRVEVLERGAPARIVPADTLPEAEIDRLCRPRPPLMNRDWKRPWVMGVLNVTPDSFSDGGLYGDPETALARAHDLVAQGVDVIDVGGESTRPGAEPVGADEEIRRVLPVIEAIRRDMAVDISIDTRKSVVAEAAIAAGAGLINDISGLSHDPAILDVAVRHEVPICLMHSRGDPKTMQNAPRYDDVVLDVFDHLAWRVAMAEDAGLARAQIMIDPGIGFGKTLEHNVALLRRLSLFHALGCPLLVGVSRKSFIGTLAGVADPAARLPGSLAAGQVAVAAGAQLLRVHDAAATRQAVSVMLPLLAAS